MNRPRVVAVAAAVSLMVACTPPASPTLTDIERQAIADTIANITRGFAAAASALDVDAFAARFASEPGLTFAADGNLLTMPHGELIDMYRAVYRSYRSMSFDWDTLRTAVLGPDAGVVSGAGHMEVTDTSGKVIRQGVAATYVFVRRGDQWQLLHGHASHRLLAP